jgi:hypothetical protein
VNSHTLEAVGLRVTIMIGQPGRYFEIRRADRPLARLDQHIRIETDTSYLVVNTRMAPAFNSKLALTAAIAQDSSVSVGRLVRLLSSS